MICCLLALLAVGPFALVLGPVFQAYQGAGKTGQSCCKPRYVVLRSATQLTAVLLLGALVVTILHFLDPPGFHNLCSFNLGR
jgi:hypothetical protein